MNKSDNKQSQNEQKQIRNSNKFEHKDKVRNQKSPYYLNSDKILYKSQYDIKCEIVNNKRSLDLSDKKSDL